MTRQLSLEHPAWQLPPPSHISAASSGPRSRLLPAQAAGLVGSHTGSPGQGDGICLHLPGVRVDGDLPLEWDGDTRPSGWGRMTHLLEKLSTFIVIPRSKQETDKQMDGLKATVKAFERKIPRQPLSKRPHVVQFHGNGDPVPHPEFTRRRQGRRAGISDALAQPWSSSKASGRTCPETALSLPSRLEAQWIYPSPSSKGPRGCPRAALLPGIC